MKDTIVQKIPLQSFKNKKGISGFKLHKVTLQFITKKSFVSVLPPHKVAGNHKHSRWEAFIGIGKGMQLHWMDQKNKNHTVKMNPSNTLFYLFIISPYVTHAVLNDSNANCTLIEFASGKLKDEKGVELIKE